MNINLKKHLHSLCLDQINQRISTTQLAIDNAKESANDDTKSSAGDKHETGRAMAQLEQEKNAFQLNELFEMKKVLEKINLSIQSASIQVGSIVVTDKINFFISVPVGKLIIEKEAYYSISINSPIGEKLKNRIKNDSFDMNGIVYKILEIF